MNREEWLKEMKKEIEKSEEARKAFWNLFIQLHPQKDKKTAGKGGEK